jgi:putative PIN family toxin of toxin-antitoxin system
MLRVVIDTNVLVSALFVGGRPGEVYEAGTNKKFRFVTSEALLKELRDVLSRPKFSDYFVRLGKTAEEFISVYADAADVVTPASMPSGTVRDKKDEMVLACAVGGQAHYVVSGDADLLSLNLYANVHIVTPSQLIEIIVDRDVPDSGN